MADVELFLASGRGDLDRVRTLVELLGVNPDQIINLAARDVCYTPLHQACKLKRVEIVKYLVQNKHVRHVDPLDRDRMTPLHFVCANGCFDLCRFLIEEGSDAEAEDKDGWRPLHWACYGGHENIVQYLVEERRVDVGARSKMHADWTPLILACRWRHIEVIRYLVPKSPTIGKAAFRFAFLKSFPWDLNLLLMEHHVRTMGLPTNYSKLYPLQALFLCPLPSECAYSLWIDQMDPYTLSILDERGRLPLHVAISVASTNKFVSPAILLKLTRKEPRAARARDPSNGLYPFQAAASVSEEKDHDDHKWVDIVYQLSRNYDLAELVG